MSSTRAGLVALVLLVALLAHPVASRAQERPDPPEAVQDAGRTRLEMTVLGMSCPFCAYGLEKKLRKIEGLESVDSDYKTGTVALTVRDGSKVSDERIRELVEQAGFEVKGEIRRASLSPEGATGAGEDDEE